MKTSQGSGSGFGLGHKYLGLGLRFAGGVIIFMLAGLALDRWQGWTPVGTIIGTLAGSVLAFLSVYRELMADEAKAREARSAEREQRP